MLVQPGVDFLALSYAVMARGGVPVFLDPGMGRENLIRCIQDAEPTFFIGSPKAHILKFLKPSLFKSMRSSICVSNWLGFGSVTTGTFKKYSSQPLPAVAAPETALIAFTSGGTGTPKGVVFTQDMIRAQLEIFRSHFGLNGPQKDVPLLPIFSLFGLACGVCTVFPPIDTAKPLSVNPERIVKIIEDLGIENSFGSPTLWLKIAEYCVRTRSTLNSLKRVFMAGASVPLATLQRVQEVAPRAQVSTPYGATEALPVTLVLAQELLSFKAETAQSGEQGTFVGAAVPGVQIKIIASDDSPISDISQSRELAAYEIGEIIVSGANVSRAYLNRPEATRASKIRDAAQIWHRMGDVGYLDARGKLYFCGRKMHVVKSPERVYCSDPVELIFNAHEKVRRSALVALNEGGHTKPAIVIEPHPQFWPESSETKEIFRRELKNLAAHSPLTAAIEKIFFHRSFPVDARHNAKIFRDKLGHLVSQGKVE
jgi:acyl-CoA synthetase (AMP-forming)/AMP-acid ligase II